VHDDINSKTKSCVDDVTVWRGDVERAEESVYVINDDDILCGFRCFSCEMVVDESSAPAAISKRTTALRRTMKAWRELRRRTTGRKSNRHRRTSIRRTVGIEPLGWPVSPVPIRRRQRGSSTTGTALRTRRTGLRTRRTGRRMRRTGHRMRMTGRRMTRTGIRRTKIRSFGLRL